MEDIDKLVLDRQYTDFKVYSVTKIKKSYGYRVILYYGNGEKNTQQFSGFKTKKLAEESRNKTITDLNNRTYIVTDKLSVKTYFTYWLEIIMKPKITSDSYDSYKNAIYNYIIPITGSIKLTALNKGRIQTLYKKVSEKSFSVTKICKVVTKTALDYALSKNLVSFNAALDVSLPKDIPKNKYRTINIDSKKTLNEDQIKVLLEKAKGTPIYLQVLFAALMGLRKSEINGLKYSDIDYIHRTLKVERQLGKKPNIDNKNLKIGEYTKQEIPVKTFSSMRELNIPDIVFDAILEEKKKYEKHKSKRINDKTTPFKDYGFICCSTYGNPRSKDFHFQHWKKLLKECNLPNIRFHDLRASFCTILLKNNFSMKAVSKEMGHASEIITVDVYGDNEEIILTGVKEIEEFIKDVLPQDEVNNVAESDQASIRAINEFIEELTS